MNTDANEVVNVSIATRPVSIDGLEFDALMESTETHESEVPSYPTEEGFEISDSIIFKAMSLSMTLFLSNTPVTWRGTHPPSPTRVQDCIKRLKEIYFSGRPVTVETTRGTLRNMAITSIELTNTKGTGADRMVPIELKQIRVTESRASTIPDSYGRGGTTGAYAGTANTTAGTASGGSPQPGSDGSAESGSRSSLLYNGFLAAEDAFGGGIGAAFGGLFN